MQRALFVAVLALAALAGRAAAAFNCSLTPCPVGAPQLCCDCAQAVSASTVTPDGYTNTAASLMALCPKCTSDLCKQCLAFKANEFGGPNQPKSYYPVNTQPYLAIADAALFNGAYLNAGVAGGSTKTLCPYITTSDTLKCFDLGYGSVSGDNYGYYESLCVAANSDLQRRCMWQYTSKSGAPSDGSTYLYEGLPTTKTAILQYTIPLCLHLQSQAQYRCLKDQVNALATSGTAIPTNTTKAVANACGIAPGVVVP